MTRKEKRLRKVFREPLTGCWLWTGAINAKGYGICGDGLVHRMMYRERFGDVPAGKYVLHHCDVRNCCNPDHLYAGKQKDNMRDMFARGRIENRRGQPAGEAHSLAVLNAEQVKEIRRLAAEGVMKKTLSEMFGVCRSQIWRIVRFERWKEPA